MPTPFEPSLKLNLRRHLPIGAMAVGGLCLSVVLFLTIRNWEHRVNQTAVESAGAQRVELLRQSLGNSLEVLHSLGSFYGLGRAISREQFARFVSEALARRPELQALSWTPRVSAADREHFEKIARSEGFADFQFTEHNPASGRMVRARDRSD